MRTLIGRLLRIGADPVDTDEIRLRKQLLLVTAVMGILAGAVWGVLYIVLGQPLPATIPMGYAVLSATSIGVLAITRRYRFFAFSQILLILILPFALMLSLGGFARSSGVVMWSLLAPLGAMVFEDTGRAPRWFAAYVGLLAASLFLEPMFAGLPPPGAQALPMFVLNVAGVSVFAFVLLIFFATQKDTALRLLRGEQQRSENLLLNVLPAPIAAILKNETRTIADEFDAASILFVDIVDFTPMSASLRADETVGLLNEVFSHFDALVERRGVEKIKTIGDAYMVAAGVPIPRTDHAHVLADLALEMNAYVSRNPCLDGRPLRFRIGINSGPVVAGVIGQRKFAYDLWGDVVNTASRMESHGEPGRIQVTRSTYELIRDEYACEPRGTVTIKGKGELETWYLVGRRDGSEAVI